MTHSVKRIISLIFVFVLLLGLAAPAFAVYININAREGKQFVYLTSKTAKNVGFRIASWEGAQSFTVKKPTVVPGTSGATLMSFHISKTTSNTTRYNTQESGTTGTTTEGGDNNPFYNGYANVVLNVEKAGTAKIKYTIGGMDKTINLNIKAYVNPVKTVTLKGVNSGNNFAAKTRTDNYMEPQDAVVLKAKTTGAKLKMVPADGWKITYLSLESYNGLERTISNYNNPMSSATINWGTLYANRNYRVYADFINTKTGATQHVCYLVHGAKASDIIYY